MPSPSLHVRERGSGVLNDFSCHSSPIRELESDCRTSSSTRSSMPAVQCTCMGNAFFTPFDPTPCDKKCRSEHQTLFPLFRRGLGTRLGEGVGKGEEVREGGGRKERGKRRQKKGNEKEGGGRGERRGSEIVRNKAEVTQLSSFLTLVLGSNVCIFSRETAREDMSTSPHSYCPVEWEATRGQHQ